MQIQKDDLREAILALDAKAKDFRRIESFHMEGYDGEAARRLEDATERLRKFYATIQ